MTPKTFDEWWVEVYGNLPNYRDNPLVREPARAAWNAATKTDGRNEEGGVTSEPPNQLIARLFPGLDLDDDERHELTEAILCEDEMPQAEWKARFHLLCSAAAYTEAMAGAYMRVVKYELYRDRENKARAVLDRAKAKLRAALGGE